MIRLKDLKVKSIAAEWVFDLYVQNASGVWQIVARFSKVNTTSAKCILFNNSTYFEQPKYTIITDGTASYSIDTKIEIANKSWKTQNIKIHGYLDLTK